MEAAAGPSTAELSTRDSSSSLRSTSTGGVSSSASSRSSSALARPPVTPNEWRSVARLRPDNLASAATSSSRHASGSVVDPATNPVKGDRSSGEASGSHDHWSSTHRGPELNGLGLEISPDGRTAAGEDSGDSDDEDDPVGRLAPEEDAILNRPHLRPGGARQWGDEEFDFDAPASHQGRPAGPFADDLRYQRRPSAATFRTVSSAGGDEWRNKILQGVKRGEERAAAERRRLGEAPVAGPSSRPDAAPAQPRSDSLRPPQESLDLPLPPSPAARDGLDPFSASPGPSSESGSARPSTSSSTRLWDRIPDDDLPTPSATRQDPAPQVERTFISVADPSYLIRNAAVDDQRSPTSPLRKPSGRNFLSQLFHRSTGSGNGSGAHGRASSLSSSGHFSQPSTPAMARAQREPKSEGMTRSASEGGASSGRPGFDRNATIRPNRAATDADRRDGLEALGVQVKALTPTMSVSRYAQPLCGAVLDHKYLLIGTVNGLDFLPLRHLAAQTRGRGGKAGSVSARKPIKPIPLIKKTKIKDLAVLELRSNILLAIAGRNDHLRVYALDGIRAMIEKKMAEINSKDEFPYLRAFGDVRRTPSKGKGRASNTPSPAIATAPSPVADTIPSRVPAGLPPSYQGLYGREAELPAVPAHSDQPPSTPPSRPTASSPLRRATTVRETSITPRDEPRRTRPNSTVSVPSSPLPNGSSPVLIPNDDRAVQLGLHRAEREAEPDEAAQEGAASGSSSAEMDRPEDANGRTVRPPAGAAAMATLAGVLRESGVASPGKSAKSSPVTPRWTRMSPRSPVSRREETDEDTTDEDVGAPAARRRRGVSLVDMLAEGPDAPPAVESQAMSRSRAGSSQTASPRPRLQPRSPLTQPPIDDDNDGPALDGQIRRPSMTLAEMLSQDPPDGFASSSGEPVEMLQRDQLGRSLASPSPSEGMSPNLSRARKRWSVFRPSGSGTSPVQNGDLPLSSSAPDLASSSRRAIPNASVDRIGSYPDLGAEQSSTPATRHGTPDPSGPRALAPPIRTRASTQKLRPVGPSPALDPEERAVEGLLAHDEEARTSPHPATLGAPLEYVKLARTKGARMLRAVETAKRTYLAVLCGDNGERVELFTGSKSISLSLNRTFVLPEMPRTIEFQMQGDDLVDIYLVYDESIFALEPATVRVREVGIGRNERRAARRERERLAREGASTNVRSGTALDQPPLRRSGTSFGLGILNADDEAIAGPTRNASRADPATATVPTSGSNHDLSTAASSFPAVNGPLPRPPDDGLTLAPPTPPQVGRAGGTVSAGASGARTRTESSPTTDGSATAWPYTMFQQLSFTPPLPASVLASTYVIPPSYDAVVSAGTPALFQSSRMGGPPDVEPPPVSVQLHPAQDNDALDDRMASPDPGRSGMPLLSPVSLLAPSNLRPSGPPGLFWISRGRKISSIVDCDGRSVLKRPMLWQSRSSPAEDVALGLRRLEMLIVERKRPVVVGFNSNAVRAFEVGGLRGGGEGDDWSNASAVDVSPLESGKTNNAAAVLGREVTYLGFSKAHNEVVWAERANGNFGVFSMAPTQAVV